MSSAKDAIKRAKELAAKKRGKAGQAPTSSSPKAPTAKKAVNRKPAATKKAATKKAATTKKTATPPKRKPAATTKKAATKKTANTPKPKRGRTRLSDEQREWNAKQHYHKRRVEQATAAFQNRKDKGVEIPVIVDEAPHLDFARTEDRGRVRYRVYGLNRFEAIRQTDPDFEPSVADALIRGFAIGVRLDWVDKDTKEEKREFHKFNPGDAEVWEYVKLSFAKGSKRAETDNFTKKKRGVPAI